MALVRTIAGRIATDCARLCAEPARTWRLRPARAIQNARLFTHVGFGHAIHWERPAPFAKEVLAFVGEIERSDFRLEPMSLHTTRSRT